jgi:uncharacterized membrane protein HdeD (DUF308 family)
MKLLDKMTRFEGFETNWQRLIIQGAVIMFAGWFMALASAVNPDAIILSARGFSWLPASGVFILALGILECIDAFFTKHQRDFTQNLQVGVFDVVVGALTIVSISGTVTRLSMMIATFLLVRGMVRIGFVYSLKLPHKYSTALGGIVSIILGILLFQQWPTDEGWFVSLCLNIEISFRGWAGISFALWLRSQKKKEFNNSAFL